MPITMSRSDAGAGRRPPAAPHAARAADPRAPRREPGTPREERVYGLNACLALFAQRPDAVRKVWLLESRIVALKPVLAWCVAKRIGYRVVEEADLTKLTASQHHEGVCFDVLRSEPLALADWLRMQQAPAQLALWLDGVSNPHNIGAILRSAAQFGASGLLLAAAAATTRSGAAARVAEGGAEAVPPVRIGEPDAAIATLTAAGMVPVVSLVRGGQSLFATALPARMLLVLGAEATGVSSRWLARPGLRISIPGSGAVESLNVSAATAVFMAEWWRQHR
jgi:TrmH RNA methyltransferase